MTETVSVIIPAWRSAPTIRRALLSVAAQTVKPLEVIVIDDGSDDDTFAVAETCKNEMNGISLIVISQANKGAGAARNVGVHAARGDWLAFLDADDEWLPTKIERSLAHAEGASLIAHDYIEVKEDRETVMDCTRHLTSADDPFAALMLRGFIPSITVLAKRADALAVGGFEETLPAAQDYDLWLKLLALPQARLVMFPEALSRYSVTGTGITSQVERRRRCSMAVLARHAAKVKRNALQIVMKRALIVQWEAIAAHLARKDYVGAVGAVLLSPLAVAEGLFVLYGAPFTLAWGLILFIAYHAYSKGYYADKFSSFGHFLFRRMTGS